MPRAKKGYQPKIQLLDMPLPYTGLDFSFPLALQRPGTTPVAVNVRGFNAYTGRRSLARRRGTAKYILNQLQGSAQMQNLDELIGTNFIPNSGNVVPGSGSAGIKVFVGLASPGGIGVYQNGALVQTIDPNGATYGVVMTLAADASGTGGDGVNGGGGSTDSTGGIYSLSYFGGTASTLITKFNAVTGAVVWSINLGNVYLSPVAGQMAPSMMVSGTVLYVSISNNPFSFPSGIYRFNTSDGTAVSSNPWISASTINSDHSGWSLTPINGGMQGTILNGTIAVPIYNSGTGQGGVLFVKADGTKTYVLNPGSPSGVSIFWGSGVSSNGNGFISVDSYTASAGQILEICTYDPNGNLLTSDSYVLPNGVEYCALDITPVPYNNSYTITDYFQTANGIAPISVNATTGQVTTSLVPTPGSKNAAAGNGYTVSFNNGFLSLGDGTNTGGGSNPGNSIWSVPIPNFGATGMVAVFGGSASSNAPNQYNRTVTLLGVAGGTVKVSYANYWNPVVNGYQALSTTANVIRADDNGGILYFADGTNFKKYDPTTNTVSAWTASSGSLPVDNAGNAPRLIVTWNGRTVLSGLPGDGQNWFMSAVGDATNWNYNPSPSVETQAVAGNNAPAGHVGDVITCMIPYRNDLLIFGCDHSIWQMSGDPMAGGRLDRISDITGIAWGTPWCKNPNGSIYFFGSRGSIYSMAFSAVATAEGNVLTRVSQAIDQTLSQLNLANVSITMAYDDRWMGLHVYISDLSGNVSVHFYYDESTQAWFSDLFTSNLQNPWCTLVYDGDASVDRTVLLGGQDGWTRSYVNSALDDDGTPIFSDVLVGPNSLKGGWDFLLNDLQMDLDQTGGSVNWQLQAGYSAQVALQSQPLSSGIFSPGRNHSQAVRASGIACYIGLSRNVSELPWAIESLRGKITVYPHTRQRVF
jgi:hypothetical protein